MKTSVAFLAFFSCGAMAKVITSRATAGDRASAICKNLDGILDIGDSSLPNGVEPSDLRLCAGHPKGVNIVFDPAQGASNAPWQGVGGPPPQENTSAALNKDEVNPLVARACYTAAQYGCSSGYCWKQCGNTARGEWCWTACKF